MNDNDIIGVIKIKDGLFICDELGAQVSFQNLNNFKKIRFTQNAQS